LKPFAQESRKLASLSPQVPFHSLVAAPHALRLEHALYHTFARFYGKSNSPTWAATTEAELPQPVPDNLHRTMEERVEARSATFEALRFEAPIVLGPIGARLSSIQTFGVMRTHMPPDFNEARAMQEIFVYWNCVSAVERVVPRYDDNNPRLQMDAQLLRDELPLLQRFCQFNRTQEEMEADAAQFNAYTEGVVRPRTRRVTRWASELRELPCEEAWATEDYALEQPPAPARLHQHMVLAPAQRREQRKVLLAAYDEVVDVCHIPEGPPLRPPACVEGRASAVTHCLQKGDTARRVAEASACRRALAILGVGNWATPFEHFTVPGLRDAWLQGWIAPVEVKAIILLFLLADVNA
jgi:hypothetical protein